MRQIDAGDGFEQICRPGGDLVEHYGVKPKKMRIGDALAKGYVLEELMETFRRYIPKSALELLKAEVAEQRALLDETKVKEEKPPQEGTEGCTGAWDGI
jgi:hypothetical protein